MFSDVIILAGGFGERLWPASSSAFPKQFMSLEGGLSFLQAAIERALSMNVSGHILVITRKEISDTVVSQCSSLLEQCDEAKKKLLSDRLFVLNEPRPIHTAGAVALGCHFLKKLFPDEEHTILVLTSDHVIQPIESFIETTEKAYQAAIRDYLVCYAIKPENPCTGYGYIKPGRAFVDSDFSDDQIFFIDKFKEKPDFDTAKDYINQGYFWNSGMFGFSSAFFFRELELYEPEVYKAFSMLENSQAPEIYIRKQLHCMRSWDLLEEVYDHSPKVSLDKGIAEKTKRACAVKATFSWKDIGSWDTFSSIFSDNQGKTADIDSKNCFVYSDLPVALCGVSDLIVVVKNNRVLVMKKGCSSLTKDAAHMIDGE
ncbi:MAG: mannose-1-phosphate guanylyltransferase [Treponemataceae bacterium]|nr:mannose-1-phosphate guanylyltransferase [Treponemataceae bacterium]